ncbi:MAG: hypothetical protein A2857_00005 [Candidatus Levybacteria bacterium RIFCSPHIGHO2_01_FULL_36_15]|nr:MAG: hypothetical protein A2857_00005 [Candidatus Levybacteria bacterium RIFCSPHIGHO2_01_FULL_36_15]OGH36930.1 MAG: hypothetical protein A2905_00925 [Candidatus Levybacteria bacterium RIFCSPLOWO2_01_FULL_36_10]
MREDEESDKLWFARLFYRHKIAHLLFPDNFIRVVGASVEPHDQELYDEVKIGNKIWHMAPNRIHRLFSKTAAVSPDHAIYSDHMAIVAEDGWIHKKSVCSCQRCSNHRDEHKIHHMKKKGQGTLSIFR